MASAGGTKSPASAERVSVSAERPATDCESRERRGVDSSISFSSVCLALTTRERAREVAPGIPAGLHREECTTRYPSPTRARGATTVAEAVKADIVWFFLSFRAATWDGWAPGARSNRGLEDSLSRRDRAPSDTTTVPLEVISRAGPPRSCTLLLVEPRVTCFHGVRGVELAPKKPAVSLRVPCWHTEKTMDILKGRPRSALLLH